VGWLDGFPVGCPLGCILGRLVGCPDGSPVGALDGKQKSTRVTGTLPVYVTVEGIVMLVNRLEEVNADGSIVALQVQYMKTLDKLGQNEKDEAAIVVTEAGMLMLVIPDD